MFRSRRPRLLVLLGAAALVALLAIVARRVRPTGVEPSPVVGGEDAVASDPVTSDADAPVETDDQATVAAVPDAGPVDTDEPATASARVYEMSAPPVVEDSPEAPDEPVAEDAVEDAVEDVAEDVADGVVEDVAAEPASPAIDLDRVERDLEGVEAALRRLDDGSYWTDEITGEALDDALLAADPVARRNVA